MIYIIFGNQKPRLNVRLKKVLEESLNEPSDDFNTASFDAREMLIQDIMKEADYIPLGCEKKVVIIENAYFLQKGKMTEKIHKDQDFSSLEEALKHSSDSCDLIFVLESSDIDKKNPVFVEATNNGKVYELLDISRDDWPSYVRKYFDVSLKVKIDSAAVNELVERVNGDLLLFQNEANKLALYTDHVTFNDVDLLVSRPLEINSFLIFNALLSGKTDEAINIYRDLLVNNEEPVRLVSMLGNQFRQLNEIRFLIKNGSDISSVARELNMNEYRVKILSRSLKNVNHIKIRDAINALYELDLNIKSGTIDRFYGFEMFLLNFNKTNLKN